MNSNNTLLRFVLLTFSILIAFGKYNPFQIEVLKNLIIIILLFLIIFATSILNNLKEISKHSFILFTICIFLFLAEVFYGVSTFFEPSYLLKYLFACIIFLLLSYLFKHNQKLCYESILYFSFGCSLIALLYSFGIIDQHFEVKNGRLIIFEENPNSISTRMSIAVLVILHFVIKNPLSIGKIRFVSLLTLPFLFDFVVATGSRGSFIALLLGILLLIYFSNLSYRLKVLIFSCFVLVGFYLIDFLINTTLFTRFTEHSVLSARETLWNRALTIFIDYPFGVGPGGYKNEMYLRYADTHDVHNLFLYVLTAGGVFSIILILTFFGELFLKSISQLRQKESFHIATYAFILFIAIKTGGVITYLIMWYLLAIVNSLNINKLVSEIGYNKTVL